MKNKLSLMKSSILILSSVFGMTTLASCGETPKEDPSTPVTEHTHTFESIDAKAATCTEDGNVAYKKCTDCDKLFVGDDEVTAEDVVVKAGHKLTPVTEVGATCTTDGVKAHDHCSVCGKDFIEGVEKTAAELKIPAAHTLVPVTEVAATCTTDGVLAHDHCSVCGKDFIEGIEKSADDLKIPAAHTLVPVSEVPATCVADGVLAHDHCSVCGKDFIEGIEKSADDLKIAATGHLETKKVLVADDTATSGYRLDTVCAATNCDEVLGSEVVVDFISFDGTETITTETDHRTITKGLATIDISSDTTKDYVAEKSASIFGVDLTHAVLIGGQPQLGTDKRHIVLNNLTVGDKITVTFSNTNDGTFSMGTEYVADKKVADPVAREAAAGTHTEEFTVTDATHVFTFGASGSKFGSLYIHSIVVSHIHDYKKVNAVPLCAAEGGHGEYYKCACGLCSSDEKGEVAITEPAKVHDVLHSAHTFDDQGVCTTCGGKNITPPVVDLGQDTEAHSNKNDQIKTSGSGNNQGYPTAHPGVWSIQGNNAGALLKSDDNSVFASTIENAASAQKGCFVRIIPNSDINTNGGTFFASFDLVPDENQKGSFVFGTATVNKAEGTQSIPQAEVNEAIIGKTYHVELLVTLEAASFLQLSFKNGANGNCKVWIRNISFMQMAEADIPDAAVSGVVAVSWPWAE